MNQKNEAFFQNRTYEQILNELKFDKHLETLEKKFKGKNIAIYGAGIMFDYIADNYDLSGFNIKAISDKSYETTKETTHKGYRALTPEELAKDKSIDIILIATQYPVKLKLFIESIIYKGKKHPKIYFLLNKPFELYLEEIF